MVASVRYSATTNNTGAVIVPGGALIASGQDYALETVSRTLAAIDVGNSAGKTQDAAGMIFAEFQGAEVKNVISVTVLRTANNYSYNFLGTDAVTLNVGFRIVNSGGVSTLRFQDSASGAAGRVAAGDVVVVTLALGSPNS